MVDLDHTIKKVYIGLFHFTESFGLDVELSLNRLTPMLSQDGIQYEFIANHIPIKEISINSPLQYDIIIDRGSCFFPYTLDIAVRMAFQGTYFINNPLSFQFFLENKYAGYGMAHDLGIAVPNTYILPEKTKPTFLSESHLVYHEFFNWQDIEEKIGFPCIFKPVNGKGGQKVSKVNSLQELISLYDKSNDNTMIVQRYISSPYPWQVRCLCIGKTIIPIKYIFHSHDESEYICDHDFLNSDQYKKIIDMAKVINKIFGYEMNSVEFIIDHNGEPWAIDFNNPIPDARRSVLSDYYYTKYKNALVQRIQEIVYKKEKSDFLPNLNQYAQLAQQTISLNEKFQKALELANEYYE